jgi:hypothetical protein
VRHLLNGIINLTTDDGSHPWHHGVEGYLHPDLAHIKTMRLKGTAVVEGDRPVVAEADECIPKHSWKPRAVLTHGMKTPVHAEGAVEVVIHVHL